MAKEEKEGKGEEVPEGFVEAIDEFYDLSDIIFKCFDDNTAIIYGVKIFRKI